MWMYNNTIFIIKYVLYWTKKRKIYWNHVDYPLIAKNISSTSTNYFYRSKSRYLLTFFQKQTTSLLSQCKLLEGGGSNGRLNSCPGASPTIRQPSIYSISPGSAITSARFDLIPSSVQVLIIGRINSKIWLYDIQPSHRILNLIFGRNISAK